MPKPEGVSFSAAKKVERTVALSSLGPGRAFRLPGQSFEEAVGGDDVGGCFYHVSGQKKDGLVPVVSFDWMVERKLPEETLVHPHNIEISIHPCQLV